MELRQATRHYAGLQLETPDLWLNTSSVLARCHDGKLVLLTRASGYDPSQAHIQLAHRPGNWIVLSPCGHYVVATRPRGILVGERVAAQVMQLTVPPLLRLLTDEQCILEQSCCAVSTSGCLAHFAYKARDDIITLRISRGSRTPSTQHMKGEFLHRSMVFSADGAWLCLIMASGAIVVVDTSTFTWTRIESGDTPWFVDAVATAVDGEPYLVVASCADISIYRIRRDSVSVHATFSNPPNNRVMMMYANPYASYVVMRRQSADEVASVIDVASGVEHPWWGLPGARCACVSDDGRLMAVGNHAETRIYATEPGSLALYAVKHDDLSPNCVCNAMLAFHDNGKALFFSTRNHGLRLTRVPPVHDQLARMLSRMFKTKQRNMPSYWVVSFILTGITL
jgi:hypothetical protein